MAIRRRRRYIIAPEFQLRYVGIILIAVFLVAMTCVLTTYYSSISILGEKLSYVYPQGRLAVTLKEVNMIVLYRVLILVPFIALVGIFLSHRIAGPAYRIEKTLREIGKGNFDIRITLRKNDELKEVADAVNDMAADLKALLKNKV